jgi:3-oxoacyl-[acyl-carrier-protein] synthase-3
MVFSNVNIKGSGVALPSNIFLNNSILNGIDTTDEWIKEKLGIEERRVCSELETTSILGYSAAINAMNDAGINKEDLDLIIVATSSPEKISPSTACIIHEKLNIEKNVRAFDVNAVCSGFVYAMTMGASFIGSGMYNNVLIIATEAYSKITDWNHKHCVFFGDGAGAVVLGKSERGWISSEILANGNGTGMTGFILEHGQKFNMNGKEVWEQAVKVLPQSIKSILKKNNTNISEISLLIPHQPSINILKIVAHEVGIPMEKVKTVMHKYANIAGASVPIAFHEAKEEGQIKKGDKILFTAIGSGWTWGSILINYED